MSSNFVTTSIIIALVLVVIYNYNNNNALVENFAGLNHAMTYKINREIRHPPPPPKKIRQDRPSCNKVSVPVHFRQAAAAPLRTSVRCKEAVDDCLQMSSQPLCRKPRSRPKETCSEDTFENMLPVTDMRTINQLPLQNDSIDNNDHQDPVVYDRLIYANAKSRLRSASDYFRGDIAITPIAPSQNPYSLASFRPSVTPHIDLNPGVMGILGGYDNSSQAQLAALMNASRTGTLPSHENIPIRNEVVTCTNQKDVVVTAFPA